MNKNQLRLRASIWVFILIPLSFGLVYVYECIYSAFKMDSRITFSATMVSIASGAPLLYYFSFFIVYFSIFNSIPKYNEVISYLLLRFVLLAVLVSPFISMYVTHKAMHSGYIECDKISWMSPNNFVKPPEACN